MAITVKVNKKTALVLEEPTAEMMNEVIIDAIQDIKGQEIRVYDLRELEDAPAEFFIFCHGTSTTQVNAMAGSIERKVKDAFGIMPTHVEGRRNASWVLVDYFDIVVHIFHRETRDFYKLEELWGDAKVIAIDEV
jgi:ribosome-associated protein